MITLIFYICIIKKLYVVFLGIISNNSMEFLKIYLENIIFSFTAAFESNFHLSNNQWKFELQPDTWFIECFMKEESPRTLKIN